MDETSLSERDLADRDLAAMRSMIDELRATVDRQQRELNGLRSRITDSEHSPSARPLGSGSPPVDARPAISRRALFGLTGAGLAGLAVAGSARPAGAADTEPVMGLLTDYWSAVATVWPEAWNADPRRSRLVHGAGIVALGFVMDAICDVAASPPEVPDRDTFVGELQFLAPHCAWTSGTWEFGPDQTRLWNELQNTSKDAQLLTNHLMRIYRDAKRVDKVAAA